MRPLPSRWGNTCRQIATCIVVVRLNLISNRPIDRRYRMTMIRCLNAKYVVKAIPYALEQNQQGSYDANFSCCHASHLGHNLIFGKCFESKFKLLGNSQRL